MTQSQAPNDNAIKGCVQQVVEYLEYEADGIVVTDDITIAATNLIDIVLEHFPNGYSVEVEQALITIREDIRNGDDECNL